MNFNSIEMEINASFKKAIQKKGFLNFIKSLFGDEKATEEIVREAVNDLKEKGLAEEAKRYLEEDANCFFEEKNGIRFLDYLPKNITLDINNILWYNNEPVAIVNHNIIPIKGKKEKLREALQEIQQVRAEAEEDGVYFESLKFGEEIAEANEIAYRFGKFFDSIEGKEDVVSRTLRNLDNLSEHDPEKEARRIKEGKEFIKNEIKTKILEELPYVKIEKKKVFGIFPKQNITLNPGYEEFFHNHLSEYTRDEIYSVLKDLEKELFYNKEKVRALKKEFEKKEGISRRKKLVLLAAGLISAAPAAYALKTYLEHQQSSASITSQPKVYSIDYPSQISTNSNLPIKINADADKVLIQLNENGISKNITTSYSDKIFYANIPVKEGFYGIEKVYAFKDGNALVKDINFALKALDNPIIHNVQYERSLSPGKEALIKVNANDTSGIKEALMLVNAPDKQFQVNASKENGLYVFRFPLEKEPSYNFKIILKDPFNQTSEYEGSISSLDNPIIHSSLINKIVEKGIAQVLINASDTSGIAKALVEMNGNNFTMEKVNGLYAYNLSLGENPETFKIKVYVIDPFNQSSFVANEINWLLQDAFKYYSFKNGINISKAEKFYSQYKDLVDSYYLLKKEDLLPALYIFDKNATLLAIGKEKIYNAPNVTDKAKMLLELSKALYDLNEKSLSNTSLNYLGNLTVYLKQNPVNYFEKEKLWNVLNITENSPIVLNGLSGKWQLNAFDDFLLTYLANNNYQKVKDYPYLLWALAYKGGYIVDLIRQAHPAVLPMYSSSPNRVKNFDIMKDYGTNHTYLELLLARENQILNSYEKGLWLIGLKPEQILPLTSNSKITADLWMLQVTLPFSIISGDALKGNWINYAYPELYKNYPEQVILLAFSHNLDAMNKLQKMYSDYLNNTTFRFLMDNKIKFYIEDDGKLNAEGARDLMALFNNGSTYAKAGLFVRGAADTRPYGLPFCEVEEYRVSKQQVFGASIGLPIFGSLAGFPEPTGSYGYDGMMTLPLTYNDYKLLKSIDQSELIWDNATMQLYPFITRTNANYYRYLTGLVRVPGIEKWWISYPAPWEGKIWPGTDNVLVYEYKQ